MLENYRIDVPESVTYNVTMEEYDDLVIEPVQEFLDLQASCSSSRPPSGTWMLAPEAGALQVGPSAGR